MDSLEILSVWHTWLEASLAPRTVEGYWGAAIRFVAANPVPLPEVTETIIAAWIESFPWRSSRRTTYFHALKSLFAFALRNGYIGADPTAGIRVPSPEEKEPRALSRDQYEALVAAAFARSPVHGYAVELLYYSAGRIGEVVGLTWDRVTPAGVIFAQTKGGRERTVPWSPGLKHAIEGLHTHFGEQDRVLPRADATVWTWVREAGRAAGIEGVHPHLLRSTAATMMNRGGAELVVVGKVLGHRKVTTTQRYRAIDQGETADAVKLL